MKEKYIAPFITLVAGLITCICDIRNKVGVTTALVRLLVVLIIFYIIGCIARKLIHMICVLPSDEPPQQEEEKEQEQEEQTEGEEKKETETKTEET